MHTDTVNTTMSVYCILACSCVCVILLVVTVVVFDEVLQQVDSSLRLYLVDFDQILGERRVYLLDRATGAQVVSDDYVSE